MNAYNSLAVIDNDAEETEVPVGDAFIAKAAAIVGGTTDPKLTFAKGEFHLGGVLLQDLSLEYLAKVEDTVQTFEKWVNKQLVRRIGVSVRQVLPERDTLGDLDATRWELGADGKPRDPWTQYDYLRLQRLSDKEHIVFRTNTHGGRRAIWSFIKPEDRKKLNAGLLPVVTIGSGSYTHTKYGRTLEPIFKIMRWANADGSDAPPEPPKKKLRAVETLNDALDDDIPF
jgi:hypothetical protein